MIGVHSILFVLYFFLHSTELLLWFSDVIYSFVDLLTLKYVVLVASTECGIFLRGLQHFLSIFFAFYFYTSIAADPCILLVWLFLNVPSSI